MRIDAPFINCPDCTNGWIDHCDYENSSWWTTQCIRCGGSGRIYFDRPKVHLSLGWRLLIVFGAVMLGAGLLYWFVVAPALEALTGEQ